MKFSVSMNNDTSVPYIQYGTDKQKNKARKFATANDAELKNMAVSINNRKHRDSHFNRNMALAIFSLPVVAGISAASAVKGKPSAKLVKGAKELGLSAAYLATGIGVVKANNKLAQNNPKLDKAEKKHPIATALGVISAAVGSSIVLDKAVRKISPKAGEALTKIGKKIGIDKLAGKIDYAPESIRNTVSKLSQKISLPKGVKEKMSTLASKVKMPEILKNGYKKIANLETTKSIVKGAKKVGNFAKANPVLTAVGIIATATVANSVKRSIEIADTKAELKKAQLKTANNLAEAYANENRSLKVSNMLVADQLDKAKSIIAEDSINA